MVTFVYKTKHLNVQCLEELRWQLEYTLENCLRKCIYDQRLPLELTPQANSVWGCAAVYVHQLVDFKPPSPLRKRQTYSDVLEVVKNC